MRISRFALRISGFIALAVLAGCQGMGRFDVVVTLEREGFRRTAGTLPSIEVNIVGVNDAELREWAGRPLSQYWMPDDPQRVTAVRKGYAYVMTFGEEQPTRQVLYRRHRVWSDWEAKASRQLFILSNFPRVVEDKEGDADVRRKILPLDKLRWRGYFWGKRVIWIEITPSGLIVHTPPLPEEQVRPRG